MSLSSRSHTAAELSGRSERAGCSPSIGCTVRPCGVVSICARSHALTARALSVGIAGVCVRLDASRADGARGSRRLVAAYTVPYFCGARGGGREWNQPHTACSFWVFATHRHGHPCLSPNACMGSAYATHAHDPGSHMLTHSRGAAFHFQSLTSNFFRQGGLGPTPHAPPSERK